jgi:hypothetical protein
VCVKLLCQLEFQAINPKSFFMKNFLSRATILLLLVIGTAQNGSAQVYVTVRPPAPVIVKPVRPSPAHVWIEEEWNARGDRYEYAGGRWMLPPHPGWVWIPGHWRRTRLGWQWFPGHWRRGGRY